MSNARAQRRVRISGTSQMLVAREAQESSESVRSRVNIRTNTSKHLKLDTYDGARFVQQLLEPLQPITHNFQQRPKMDDTHLFHQFIERLFERLSALGALNMHLLLHLNQPVSDGMEEVRFKIVGVILPN